MRACLSALVTGIALCASGAAFAGSAQDEMPTSISYSSNDGMECHALVHEGEITRIVECRDKAGWERQRHLITEQTIIQMQLRSELGGR